MEKPKKSEVLDERLTLLNAREAAQYLRVSLFTLSRIEREGGIVPFRTPGGHRRYSLRMLHEYLEKSRSSWNDKSRAAQSQQRATTPESVERPPLEVANV
ncbi:MAG TPA: helix-turn-helix domain-containing protein [Anaerolineae bacterium]|nr:helix-turn-helix domain-containing protein [Anaerolineae bacterium]